MPSEELRSKVLAWQQKYNIPDGDPALALIELLDIYSANGAVAPKGGVSAEQLGLQPTEIAAAVEKAVGDELDKLTYQTQNLRERLENMNLEAVEQSIAQHHEGIEYCSKKLEIFQKDFEAAIVRLGKVTSQVNPVARGAVFVLMLASGAVGFILSVILR